jgi:high-affinity iron transporter
VVGSALILLREGLEGALIIAIVLAYLGKLGRRDRFGTIWAGAGAAAAIAFAVGIVLFSTVGELEGDARKLTFAVIMAVAACVLTWMIFWMRKQARAVKGDLQTKVDQALVAGSAGALAAVVFVGVLREGIETVLFFLAAAGQSSTVNSLVGGGLGLLGAAVLAYAFYRGAAWLDLRQFFMVSGAIVLLFAAGLLARSIAEFQVLGHLPTFWYPVFDVTWITPLAGGHFLGDLLRGLFGWDAAPSIEELGLWLAYVVGVGILYFRGMPRPRLLPRRRRERSAARRVGSPGAPAGVERSDA